MPDLVILVVEVQFALLFAISLWHAIHNRHALAWDVTLVFLPIVVLFAVQLADDLAGPLPQWLRTTGSAALLAQPVFSLKLVADLRAIPRWILPAAIAAAVAAAALLFATAGQGNLAVTLAGLGVFIATEAVAAGYLALEARGRVGSARIRLAVAAIATGSLALVLLVAAAGAVVGAPPEVTGLVTRVIALAAAVGYGVAFLPPRWLREVFQASEAFNYQERILASPPSADPSELWGDLARAVHHATGAGAVVLAIDGSDLRTVASDGVPVADDVVRPADMLEPALRTGGEDQLTVDILASTGRRYGVSVPMIRDGEAVGVVYLLRHRPSLFDADDATLVRSLAARSANLVQRREALAAQERLGEQLAVTVEALRAASAAKSDFLASMSHELRTPLNAIIGFSDLMVADAGDARTVTVPREWVDHIRNGGMHLVGLINDVLDLAKVEAGRLELAIVPVELGLAVAESIAGLRPLADRKALRVTADIEPVVVSVDAGRLRQILYNLLSNAIKYTGVGGSIRVTASLDGAEVRLAVADTGVGIDPEHRAQVFEEFRQVGDHAGRVEGTGLGLALTKRLVEAHGGRMELESELGRGSTFTVILPVGDTAAPPAPVRPTTTAPALGRPRILAIEDDPSSVRLLQAYLADAGYDVVVAADGETGLAMARSDPPAAIVLDILLPRIDGWEVLRRLKSDPAVRDVPVVIVTVVDERNVGLALGAVDYFVKPIERDALIARLGRHAFTTKVQTQSVQVLAIDDDPAALAVIDAALSPLGFRVRTAASGADGLEMASQIRPDLVICDLLMPGIDGFGVVRQLKANPATASTPILIVTAHELTEAEKQVLNGRVLGVIAKGDLAADGLRDWLAEVAPALVGPAT